MPNMWRTTAPLRLSARVKRSRGYSPWLSLLSAVDFMAIGMSADAFGSVWGWVKSRVLWGTDSWSLSSLWPPELQVKALRETALMATRLKTNPKIRTGLSFFRRHRWACRLQAAPKMGLLFSSESMQGWSEAMSVQRIQSLLSKA